MTDVRRLDRVRVAFTEVPDDEPNPVWQGWFDGYGMAGADIFVSPDTARRFLDHLEATAPDDQWFKDHNPHEIADALAWNRTAMTLFGPMYELGGYTLGIVQRYDEDAKRWRNVEPVYGDPKPVGFSTVHDAEPFVRGSRFGGPQPYVAVGPNERDSDPHVEDTRGDVVEALTTMAEAEGRAAEMNAEGKRYFDHNGNRTDDPRCELGFCVDCIEHVLDGSGAPVPALSTADPAFRTDATYRAEVMTALRVAGVTLHGEAD
jgi:hypothetical protein